MVPPFLKRMVLTPPSGLPFLTTTVADVTVFLSPPEPRVTAITTATTATTAARPSSTVRCLEDMRSPFVVGCLVGGQPTGGGPLPAPAAASAGSRRGGGASDGRHDTGRGDRVRTCGASRRRACAPARRAPRAPSSASAR